MKTPLFNIRLDQSDRQILDNIARRDGVTLSDAVRKLIRANQTNDRAPTDRRDGAVSVSGP